MALITREQWEAVIGAAKVATLCAASPDEVTDETVAVADSDVVAEMLSQASDYVLEFAASAGASLTAGTITPAMRRRVAMVAAHYAASRKQTGRDAKGRAPYAAEYDAATAELEAWAARVRQTSADEPSEGPVVLSDDLRGW